MRMLFIALVALWVAVIVANGMGRDAEVKLAIHEAESQKELDNEQLAILLRLESHNDSTVSEFVRDWRAAHPAASNKGLEELRIIEQKISNDPTAAAQFTRAAHQKRADKLNAEVSAPFGGKFESKVGL